MTRLHAAEPALAGVRVLDLSQGIAGPFAARLLGDFGADVTKVEPPGGDPARELPPLKAEAPPHERSLFFQYLNWNKRGIVLDLTAPGSAAFLRTLVEGSDIVIESFRPGFLAGLGLSPAAMLGWNPRVVVTSVTDFGQTGPYAGFRGNDLVLQAMAGIMQISGTAEGPPLKHGLSQAYLCAGLNAAYVSAALLLAAEADGVGDHVDLSVHECLTSELVMSESYYSFMGAIHGRRLANQDPFAGGPIPARRGFVAMQSGGPTPLGAYADLLGNEAFRQPSYSSNAQRARHIDEVRRAVKDSVRDRDPKELFLEGSRRRLLMGVAQTAGDLLGCEQLAARDFFATLSHPATGTYRFPAEIVKLSATPTSVRARAPLLGEHAMPPPVAPPSQAPAPGRARLPFEGLRVLDLSTVVAVPYLGGLLADLGAEVIKIESPARLDQTRQGVFTTYLDDDTSEGALNRSGIFQVLNRGKRSLALDLAQPAGRDLFRSLATRSDIVLENYTPRVMRSWGLDYRELHKVNPALIMLSNTGYGSTGPWSAFPSQGTTLEVTMGVASYTGYRGGPPSKAGQSYPDFLACWTGLLAVSAALRHRRRTGEGQWVDLGMYGVGVALIPEPLLSFQLDGTEPARIGNEHPEHVPSNVYPSQGDDRWVALTVGTDAEWRNLAGLMAADQVDHDPDPRFATAAGRRANRDAVNAAVGRWTRARPAAEIMRLLQGHGIACGPVLDNRDLLLDEHLAARGFHQRVEHPAPMGVRPIMGRPWQLRNRTATIRKPAPAYGGDSRDVLRDVLGLSARDVDGLLDAGVVLDRAAPQKPVDSMRLPDLQRLKAIRDIDPNYRSRLGLEPASQHNHAGGTGR